MRRSFIQTMSNQDRYDSAFLGILQNEGQIQEFLDVFFSFLYRRTDFFRHLITPTDKYGFRAGVAKKLVLNAFKKYESLAAEKNRKLKEAYEKFVEEEKTKMDMDTETCEVVVREEIVEEVSVEPEVEGSVEPTTCPRGTPVPCDDSTGSSGKDEGMPWSSGLAASETSQDVPGSNSDDAVKDESPAKDQQATNSVLCTPDPASVNHYRGGNDTDRDMPVDNSVKVQSSAGKNEKEEKRSGGLDNDDDDDDELARAQRLYQANPESYNGAIRENYSWSQSIADLDVRVKVPGFVKSSKKQGVSVKVDRKHLRVTYKDLMGSEVVVINDDLCWEVHRDESTWSLVPGEQVHISMEKVQERWWDALLEGEPKISTRKIDPSRPITDLGDEEQAKIAEMMYNERQKRLGLPQSHEQKTHELLKKAWDAEGSPFKGQPFDPTKLNISTGGGGGGGGF